MSRQLALGFLVVIFIVIAAIEIVFTINILWRLWLLCQRKDSRNNRGPFCGSGYFYSSLTAASQQALLFLFVYPMMRLRWARISTEDQKRKGERDIVMASTKRCSISTICASVTEFIIAALVEIQFSPKLIMNLLLELNKI